MRIVPEMYPIVKATATDADGQSFVAIGRDAVREVVKALYLANGGNGPMVAAIRVTNIQEDGDR